jgi:hypothetical protein
MIKFVNRLAVFVLTGVIAAGVAFGKTNKKTVTFIEPVVVNGALVKAGSYTAEFDDQTNELLIVKGRKVIARAPAQLEERDPGHAAYVTRAEDTNPTRAMLLNVTLSDGKKAVIGDNANGTSAQ